MTRWPARHIPTHFNLHLKPVQEKSHEEASIAIPEADLATMIQQFQRDVIQKTLEGCDRNWAATARQLNLDSGNLHRLAKRLGIK